MYVLLRNSHYRRINPLVSPRDAVLLSELFDACKLGLECVYGVVRLLIKCDVCICVLQLNSVSVGSTEGSCAANGFELKMPLCTDLLPVTLQAGDVLPISIAFTPDCTATTVSESV